MEHQNIDCISMKKTFEFSDFSDGFTCCGVHELEKVSNSSIIISIINSIKIKKN